MSTSLEAAGVELRPSLIEGTGVFAMRAFAPAERIWQVTEGRLIPGVELDDPPHDAPYRYDYRPEGTVVLDHPNGLFNHSCDPNAYDLWEPDGTRWKVARRPIATGDEITTDYSINSWGDTVWRCTCGAARCRHDVHSSFFHLPAALQVEYYPLLAAWFIDAFRADVAALAAREGLPLPG